MRFLRRSLTGLFLMVLTLAFLAWAGQMVREAVQARMSAEPRSFPQRERVFAVNVQTITPETLRPTLTAFGEVQSRRTLELRSAVGGTVVEASAALVEGGAVAEGDLLLRIDPAAAEAARDRAAADLQDAEAELRDGERSLILAQDELAAAEAQATLRQQALTRARDLQDRGVGTAAAVESAELALSSAEAAILTRRQSLAAAEARIDQARTRLARARIGLQETERDLADTRVTAPFDGLLSDVTLALGGRVSPNERFATLLDPNALEVAFRVSTSQYARLLQDGRLPSLDATVTLDVAGVDLAARGVISREGAAVADGQTGRLLFARLETAPGFRPGDFVTVRIDETPQPGVALIPATAVGPDDTVLVVNEDNRLESRTAEVLRRQGDQVLIRAGPLAGQTLVTERSPVLGAGIGVRPIRPGGEDESAEPAAPETVSLDPDRRARLVAFVEESRMPEEAKTRILSQLEQEEVPAQVVSRLESRMGS